MVFFLFFLIWDLFSSQLRDVWDEGVLKSSNFNEKTALKLQVRASSPDNYGPTFRIAIRNFCTFLTERTREQIPLLRSVIFIISVRNFCPEVFFT
jgi:hypothetical protein